MTGRWSGSTRRSRLPSNWTRLARAVLERDGGRCHVCGASGADGVDHIVPETLGGTDDPSNLAAIHHHVWPYCHRTKSAREGGQAAAAVKAKARRPPEPHPGLL